MIYDFTYFKLELPEFTHVHHAGEQRSDGSHALTITFNRSITVHVRITPPVKAMITSPTYVLRCNGESVETTDIDKVKTLLTNWAKIIV